MYKKYCRYAILFLVESFLVSEDFFSLQNFCGMLSIYWGEVKMLFVSLCMIKVFFNGEKYM